MSAIVTACWWCGIIDDANVTSALLKLAPAIVPAIGVVPIGAVSIDADPDGMLTAIVVTVIAAGPDVGPVPVVVLLPQATATMLSTLTRPIVRTL